MVRVCADMAVTAHNESMAIRILVTEFFINNKLGNVATNSAKMAIIWYNRK
jgi:hypothetical protein